MSKKNPQKSTRNTEFNSFIDDNKYINSTTTVTATQSAPNIRLLEYSDSITKKGSDIKKDAENNHTMSDNNYDAKINTDNLTDGTDYYIYGAPHKMVLDNHQQYSNCGVDSALNILVMGGLKTISDQNKTETTFTKQLWTLGLCTDAGVLGKFETSDGGTSPNGLKDIFSSYDITSKGYSSSYYAQGLSTDGYATTLLSVANILRKGGSAVIAVSSKRLWGTDTSDEVLDHAVTVTGVVYDTTTVSDNTVPVGFYIHDTGGWMTRYISYNDMKSVTLFDIIIPGEKDEEGVFGTVVTDPIKKNTDCINATGNKYDNKIYGNSADNVIKGVGGTNILVGGAGNDTIYGGSGNDTIYGNDENAEGGTSTGTNSLYGGAGKDTIYGGSNNDLIYGGKGNDSLCGNAGRDALYGDAGNDTIHGGAGNDRLSGGAGDDVIYGDDGYDTLIGGSGNDTICGGTGNDTIECGSGTDTVFFFEGDGIDVVTSSSGSVNFACDYDLSRMNLYMEKYDAKNNYYNLMLVYKNEDSEGFDFNNFLNTKNNSCKTAYLIDNCQNEEAKTKYRLGATSSSGKVKVKSSTENNIFFSMSQKSNNITTSKCDDIVYMYSGDDTITYSGGKDNYLSFAGNDTYVISSLDKDTFLSINDSTDPESTEVSLEDEMKLDYSKSSFSLFFDMKYSAGDLVIENNSDMFIVSSQAWTTTNFSHIADGSGSGLVKINDYYGNYQAEKTGKGKIEYIYTKESTGWKEYKVSEVIPKIKQDVAAWFSNYGGEYSSVFEALQDASNEHLTELVTAYTNNQPS